MPKSITVTQDLIDKSTQRNSSHCMIAEAIKDTIPRAKRVSVDLATIRYTLGDTRYVFLTPRPAQVKLLQFDNGESLSAFQFRLGRAAQTIPVRKRQANKTTVKVNASRQSRRSGGKTPPKGPLAGGTAPQTRGKLRTGAVRSFGLKAIGGALDRP